MGENVLGVLILLGVAVVAFVVGWGVDRVHRWRVRRAFEAFEQLDWLGHNSY